jgi:hypothetical protein
VRGPLRSIDLTGGSFRVSIRPFHLRDGRFGSLTVTSRADTAYEVGGQSYQGDAGLAQLANKPVGTATIAIGNLNVATHAFEAEEVYAGSGVPFGASDTITGSVVARDGKTLTVRGATLARADGTFTFRDQVLVTLGGGTKVTRQLIGGPATITDISVGQRITVLGRLAQDADAISTMDATCGLVRMPVSSVAGQVSQVNSGALTVTLQTVSSPAVRVRVD